MSCVIDVEGEIWLPNISVPATQRYKASFQLNHFKHYGHICEKTNIATKYEILVAVLLEVIGACILHRYIFIENLKI